MRRRSCVANPAREHRLLLRSARNVPLHQTPPLRARLRMPQRRRRRLYALTYSTSLTLASTTSKKVFNSLLQRSSRRYSTTLHIYLPFSPVISGALVSISSVDKVPSLYFQSLGQLYLVVSCGEAEDLELAQVHTCNLDYMGSGFVIIR